MERISHYYPEHDVFSEEGTHYSHNSEYLWAIDPIDGTRAFASGMPIWGISLGIICRENL